MKANTPGEELGTVALVEKLKQFVESNDDKVPPTISFPIRLLPPLHAVSRVPVHTNVRVDESWRDSSLCRLCISTALVGMAALGS
jgi:hypothetical protein